jgi:transposase
MDIWINCKELAELVKRHYQSPKFRKWAKSAFPYRKIDGYSKSCGRQILQFNIDNRPDLVKLHLFQKSSPSLSSPPTSTPLQIRNKQAMETINQSTISDRSYYIAQNREEILLSVDRFIQMESATKKTAEKSTANSTASNSSSSPRSKIKLIKRALRVLTEGMSHRSTLAGRESVSIMSTSYSRDSRLQSGKATPGPQEKILKVLGVRNLSLSTYYRWRKAYDEAGCKGLLPGVLSKSAQKEQDQETKNLVGRPTSLTEEARKEILAMLFEHPRRSARAIWHYLHLDRPTSLPQLLLEGQPISYPTVRRFAAAMHIKHKSTFNYIISHTKGKSKWRGKHGLAIGEAADGICWPNERWEIDSSVADVCCNDGIRHKVICLVDVRSRSAIVRLYPSSSGWNIAQTLKCGFQKWGLPNELLRDNGLDYQSKIINQICIDLDIKTPKLPPYAPERKPHVERFFGTLSRGLFNELTGFTGNCLKERPELIIQKYSSLELQTNIDNWVTNIYDEQVHSTINMRPREAFHMPGWTARKITDPHQIDLLLMPSKKATVRKGTIQHNNCVYYASDFVNYEGQKLEIRIDMDDAAHIYCFEPKDSPGSGSLQLKQNNNSADNSHEANSLPHDINRKAIAAFICIAEDVAVIGLTPADIKKEQARQKRATDQLIKAQQEANTQTAKEYGYNYNNDKDFRMQERLKQAAQKKPVQLHPPKTEEVEIDQFKDIQGEVDQMIGSFATPSKALSAANISNQSASIPPEPVRPEYFLNEEGKYKWCFEQKLAGRDHLLTTNDLAFMTKFEASELYQESIKSHYELLLKHFKKTAH